MGCTRRLARWTARAYAIAKASLVGGAAGIPANSSCRATTPVPGLADTFETSTAFLGVTTLALIGTDRRLGLSAATGKPAHPRDGGYRTTNKRAAQQLERPAPRNAAISQSPRDSVEGSLPLGTVGTVSLCGDFPVVIFCCHGAPSPNKNRPPVSGSRLRHWLLPSQAPICGTGFSASPSSQIL